MVPESIVDLVLVEDNPMDLELALHALRHAQLTNRIEVARDGAEALALLARLREGAATRPRVILLDLKLPLVSGLEVLAQIKQDPLLRSIPVVVLTSSREDPDISEAYRLGANSFIVKPVDFEQFSEVIRLLGMYWVLTNQPLGA